LERKSAHIVISASAGKIRAKEAFADRECLEQVLLNELKLARLLEQDTELRKTECRFVMVRTQPRLADSKRFGQQLFSFIEMTELFVKLAIVRECGCHGRMVGTVDIALDGERLLIVFGGAVELTEVEPVDCDIVEADAEIRMRCGVNRAPERECTRVEGVRPGIVATTGRQDAEFVQCFGQRRVVGSQ